jgi:ribonucleoside-triphosphate reductase
MEEGDSSGMPFAFPKGDFHIDKKAFLPENKWILDCLAKAIAINGSPYMIFDRGDGWKISQCCRLQKEFGEGDKVLAKDRPEDVRFQAIQNITLNLPRIGYRYQQSRTEQGQIDPMEFVKKEMDRLLDLCLVAHKAKKKYIKKLMALDNSPLHLLKYGMDGKGYMDLEKVVYLVGLLGLNEMVQAVTGKELHESDAAFDFGMKSIAYLSLRVKEIGEKEGMAIVLEESPAESTSKRLAKLDDYYFNGAAAKYIRGNKETGAIYYTNSVHLREDCGVDFVERIRKQSKFHAMVSGGSIIHLWVGENLPAEEAVINLMQKTFSKTRCTQLTISPEFTLCEKCLVKTVGLKNKCPKCGNDDLSTLTQITRVVGYFSRVSNWVDSKKVELTHRQHDFALEGKK